MSKKKQKLELTWIGKEKRPRLEPRLLIENKELSYFADIPVSEETQDLFADKNSEQPKPTDDNILIHGDNLLALKALEHKYAGKVKCIYIDPPYNTGQAFTNYDDGLEHSMWLTLFRDRIEALKKLMTDDGVIFCQLNDDECAYAKILFDEVLGRSNFINQVSVKMKLTAGASGGGEDKKLKKNIEYILIYAKNYDGEGGFNRFNNVFDETDLFSLIDEMEAEEKSWKYTSILQNVGEKIDDGIVYDGRGKEIKVTKYKGFSRTTVNAQIKAGFKREEAYINNFNNIFSDTNAQTSIRTRIINEFKYLEKDELLVASYIPCSGRDKGKVVQHYYISPTIRRVIWLKDSSEKRGDFLFKKEKLGTYWDGFPLNNLTKEGGVKFPNGKKPEALIKQIIDLATDEGDLILDSFAGSGTTGAVAHKMGRRWIMVELGEHSKTHIVPRLKKVIDGEDQGGISKAVNWQGGGGFRYYHMAESLLKKDKWGNWIINRKYNAEMLSEAMCKHMAYTYAPSKENFWQHGYSTENNYIYVTTGTLSNEQLQLISREVGKQNTLLICCKGFIAKNDEFSNLNIKKIPKSVLHKCEWDQDDYSFNINVLPEEEDD